MPDTAPLVYTEYDGAVAIIRMQDPAKRNALGTVMLSQLVEAFDELAARETRAVILRAGALDRVWCAGFDINALASGVDPLSQDGMLQALFRRVRDCDAPVIAMLHGSAWGGGTDLALRCDIAVADPTCTLAFTPARLGLPYDPDGLLNVMLRGGLHVAMEMFSTADPVSAERAARLRLLNHVVPETELEAFTYALAQRIATNAPLSVASAKQQLRALAEAMPVPSARMQALLEGRRRALDSQDYRNGIAAFHARRTPTFEGR